MAWLYKQKKSKYWWIGWRIGKTSHFRSTKQTDRAEAEKELGKVESLFYAHKVGLLDDVYQALSGKTIPKVTLKAALDQWVSEIGGSTHDRYASIAGEFASFMGATETGPLLTEITTERVREYLHSRRRKCSASTTNLERKILSVFFRRAIKNQQLRENPVFPIRPFEDSGEEEQIKRRPFTLQEMRDIYQKAPNAFWRYMIVGEAYTGLRMGDLITLRWECVDFEAFMVRLMPKKTRRKRIRVQVPIPKGSPFYQELRALWLADGKPKSGPLWPEQAANYVHKGAGPFSNEFYELILVPCGLATVRENKKGKGKGRGAARQINPVSFHSLRHSFVTLLKASGASQVVAKQLAGHTNDLVSNLYTDLPGDVLTKAIEALPAIALKKI